MPQESVLSPTLYNIYTLDLKIGSSNWEMALFAGDTAIYFSAKILYKGKFQRACMGMAFPEISCINFQNNLYIFHFEIP